MKKSTRIFFLTLGIGYSGVMLADEEKKTPKPQNKETSQYLTCRKKSLKLFKAGFLDKNELEAEGNSCKSQFPGAAVFIDCKKVAFKKNKKDPKALKASLLACKDVLAKVTFNPEDPVPFYFHRRRLYFAGVPLFSQNGEDEVKVPKFNCSAVNAALKKPQKAEFMFFGNHPKVFESLKDHSVEAIRKSMKLPTGPNKKGKFVAKFGKVFGDIKDAKASAYFPTASCSFDRDSGEFIDGLKVSYLLEEGLAFPYVAIIFYKKMPEGKKAQELIDALAATLNTFEKNHRYTVSKNPKKPQLILSSFPINDFDEEGDPHNVCKKIIDNSLVNRYLGIVQWDSKAASFPEYILLANVSLMCDMGNRLATKF